MKTKSLYFAILFILSNLWLSAQTVMDIDSNVYKTITYKSKIWMAENLATSRFNDGTDIPIVEGNVEWINLKTPAMCWYNNDTAYFYCYGAFYNWYAVNTKKLCPIGWRLPSKTEWENLIMSLGGERAAGGRLKATGNTTTGNGLWQEPNEATDELGFSALPSGGIDVFGRFFGISQLGYFWTATKDEDPKYAWLVNLDYLYPDAFCTGKELIFGAPVRCIKE